jgi:ParB-like chromosome segregation protein Spo0J
VTFRTKFVDPREVKIPDVRVNARMDEELAEQFRNSIGAAGIKEMPVCYLVNGELVVVDGRHRVEEAIAAGIERVQVAFKEATRADVYLDNLATTFLKGKADPVEVLEVIAALTRDQQLDSDAIARRTGMTRDYVERLQTISGTSPEVLNAFREGAIGVSIAYLLARVEKEDMRLRLLEQQLAFRWTAKELAERIKLTKEIAQEPEAPRADVPPTPLPTAACQVCGAIYPTAELKMFWIDERCVGDLADARRQAAHVQPSP